MHKDCAIIIIIFLYLFTFHFFLQLLCISLVSLTFCYSAHILLENALFCRQNARLKNRLFCSKFCRQNLSKPIQLQKKKDFLGHTYSVGISDIHSEVELRWFSFSMHNSIF